MSFGSRLIAARPTYMAVLCLSVAGMTAAMACSASSGPGSRTRNNNSGSGGITVGSGGTTGSGGSGPVVDIDSGVVIDPGLGGPCDDGGWACAIDKCEGQASKTTVRATIYDPKGEVPLYNVAVYVPNQSLAEITTGAVCETCATPVSGQPIASALTNSAGEFVMEDVPVGVDVPMVIQIGKWRRMIHLPEVVACQENAFNDPQTFRLPRNQSEGHIPKIAMSSGEADSLECLLRRIGVDDAEFTNPDGTGRINIFADAGSASSYAAGGVYPSNMTLFNTDTLMGYDIVMMSCQGSNDDGRKWTTEHKTAMKSFADSGGRVFLEHYHHSWLRGGNEIPEIEDDRKYPMTPFPAVATWGTAEETDPNHGDTASVPYEVDVSFPKGNDFADWLVNVGASTTKGTINMEDVKHPALDVIPGVSLRWIYRTEPIAAPYLTANTPIGAPVDQQCGSVVHTGIHVANAADDSTTNPFPSGCTVASLTAQEKAMEFLFFDLSSCVQDWSAPPMKPPVVF